MIVQRELNLIIFPQVHVDVERSIAVARQPIVCWVFLIVRSQRSCQTRANSQSNVYACMGTSLIILCLLLGFVHAHYILYLLLFVYYKF